MIILGIDAAWSERNASGVAVLRWENEKKPELITLGRSYREMMELEIGEKMNFAEAVRGEKPKLKALLAKISMLTGELVKVAAFDLPLSDQPILGRRECDDLVSKKYGSRGASVHSPSQGSSNISEDVYRQMCDERYRLEVEGRYDGHSKVFIEVYPHIAIIKLLNLDYRLPYKVEKRNSYWKDAGSEERKHKICESLEMLRNALKKEINGIEELLPPPEELLKLKYAIRAIKSYEDALDAIVCAWVGGKYAMGQALSYGNSNASIWEPELLMDVECKRS